MRIFKIICVAAAALALLSACRDGKTDERIFTIQNENGMKATFCTTGGRLLRLEVPARDGSMKNVVWGCADADACAVDKDYRQCIVGRYGNRIAGGRFELGGFTYQLSQNEGKNHIHGNLDISVICTLTDKNELVLQYAAVTDAPTILNPTLHAWFNLHGDGEGLTTTHILKINADWYTPVNEELIPTGEIAPVDSTAFDFREGKPVTPEFDHNFVLRGAPGEPALELYEPGTGILLRVYTDQPGLQLYSGRPDCGVVLETQNFPDAPNHPNFPDAVLGPGENYVQNTIYRFEIL